MEIFNILIVMEVPLANMINLNKFWLQIHQGPYEQH
jgi:hypothetical protein